MKELIAQILPAALPLIGTGLLSLATWLAAAAARYLAAKARTSRAAAVGSRVADVVKLVVLHVESNIRPEVQKALSDGKLTAEEAAALKKRATALVLEALGTSGIAELSSAFNVVGDQVAVLVSGWIEKAILDLKAGEAPASPQ